MRFAARARCSVDRGVRSAKRAASRSRTAVSRTASMPGTSAASWSGTRNLLGAGSATLPGRYARGSMTRNVHAVAASGYRAGAAAYERGRPSFPDEAVDWLLARLALPAGEPLLELGAGTGKLTRQLVARGLHVLAVEPVP